MRELIELLEGIALTHGASLVFGEGLFCHPLQLQRCAKTEFSHGVLATVAEIYLSASRTPEGRKAICDLGFQPLPQDIEGER